MGVTSIRPLAVTSIRLMLLLRASRARRSGFPATDTHPPAARRLRGPRGHHMLRMPSHRYPQSSVPLLRPRRRANHDSMARARWRFPLVEAIRFWVHVYKHGVRLRYGLNNPVANRDPVDHVGSACRTASEPEDIPATMISPHHGHPLGGGPWGGVHVFEEPCCALHASRFSRGFYYYYCYYYCDYCDYARAGKSQLWLLQG